MHKLPKPYQLGEEIANAITHGLGVLMGITGLSLLVARAILYAPEDQAIYYITAFAIFGSSIIFLYLMSTLYHSLLLTRAYPVFERLDHSAIYVLIAGTYTAYCLTALRGTIGWPIFGLIWGLAVIGIVFYAIFGSRLRVVSLVTYLAMGWIIIFFGRAVKPEIPPASWFFLLAGGAAYTSGAIVYALKKVRWTHPLWHLFVLAGTLFHFLSIWNLL